MNVIPSLLLRTVTMINGTNTQFRNLHRRNILLIAEARTLHLRMIAARGGFRERHNFLLDAARELNDQRALNSVPAGGASGEHDRVVGLVVASGVLAPGSQPR